MRVILTVIAGPHKGIEFSFDKHDTFLVGRSKHAHFQMPAGDKFFSRVHFMLEVNPPQCRLIDMGSHNGTFVNGEKVLDADLKANDQIRAGHTVLRVRVVQDENADTVTLRQPDLGVAGTGVLPVVPGYTLVREVGRGRMGITYLGQRNGDSLPRAIKVVQPSFEGSASQIDDFLSAARALTSLDHANIIRLREVGICPTGFFFASNFIAGQSVAQTVEREGPQPIKRTLRIASQMLRALQYAHASPSVHRDIKPTNVLLTESEGRDVVSLADFAVAHVYQAAPFSGLSLTADILSSAAYMPPEVLFSYKEVNQLADQYSVSAVLYYLLTGKPAMEIPKTDNLKYSTLLRRQCIPIRDRRKDVPESLAAIIHKGLTRLPTQRFASVGEFGLALSRVTKID